MPDTPKTEPNGQATEAQMKQLTQDLNSLLAGISPHIVCQAMEDATMGRAKLEHAPRKRRLWRAMSTALTRARLRWEKSGSENRPYDLLSPA